jgi:hypothetical protein
VPLPETARKERVLVLRQGSLKIRAWQGKRTHGSVFWRWDRDELDEEEVSRVFGFRGREDGEEVSEEVLLLLPNLAEVVSVKSKRTSSTTD